MIACPGIPGQHVDEADLVWRLGFRGNGFGPFHAVVIGTQWRAIWTDQTSEAVGASLKRVRLAVLHHDDSCFGNDLLRRSGLHLSEICRLRGRHFISRERKRDPAANE